MSHQDYQLVPCPRGASPEQIEQVAAMLEAIGAFDEAGQIPERAAQARALAYAPGGELAAVLTAEARHVEQFHSRLWVITVIVHPEHRQASLPSTLAGVATEALEQDYLAGYQQDVIGIFMVVQTRAFEHRRDMAVTPLGYAFVGRNRRGDNMRVKFFRGACIGGGPPLAAPAAQNWMLDERYRVQIVRDELDEELLQRVAQFLLDDGAFKTEAEARQRAEMTVAVALGPDDAMVGQLAAEDHYVGQLINRFWAITVFVSPDHRHAHLARHLLLQSRDYLNAAFTEGRDPAVIGLYLRMQSPRLRDDERPAVSFYSKLLFLGRNRRGDNLRISYFDGAGLTPP